MNIFLPIPISYLQRDQDGTFQVSTEEHFDVMDDIPNNESGHREVSGSMQVKQIISLSNYHIQHY